MCGIGHALHQLTVPNNIDNNILIRKVIKACYNNNSIIELATNEI